VDRRRLSVINNFLKVVVEGEIDVVYENNAEFELSEFLNDTNIPNDVEVKEAE